MTNAENISIEKIDNGYMLTYVASNPARIVKEFCATKDEAVGRIIALIK